MSYMIANLLPGGGYQPDCSEHANLNSRSWIIDFVENDKTAIAYPTSCCLSAGFFARTHGMKPNDVQAGLSYYTRSLSQLVTNLNDPATANNPSNVAGALLLSIYELAISNSGRGWIYHAGGIGRMIQMRGPSAHQDGLAKNVYMMSRFPIISNALGRRRRCYLEDHCWLSDEFGDVHTEFQRLLDVFAKLPGLLEENDRLKSQRLGKGIGIGEEIERYSQSLIATISKLFVWRWSWEETYPNMAYEIPMKVTQSGEQSPFEPALYYRDFQRCRETTLYNAALLILLPIARSWGIIDASAQTLWKLRDHSRQAPCSSNLLMLPNENMTTEAIAREICRSVKYHLQGSHRMNGAMMLLLPLRVVGMFLRDKREKEWLVGITTKIATDYGFQISEGVSSRTISP